MSPVLGSPVLVDTVVFVVFVVLVAVDSVVALPEVGSSVVPTLSLVTVWIPPVPEVRGSLLAVEDVSAPLLSLPSVPVVTAGTGVQAANVPSTHPTTQ